MNAMNIELRDNRCLKLDELASGDVEVSLCSRESIKTPDEKNHVKDWYPLAKSIVPSNRLDLIINFLQQVKDRQ